MRAQPTTKQLIEMLYERLPELFDRAAAQPAPVPLTEVALLLVYESEQQVRWGDHVRGLRAIEAAHGIKE